MKKINGYHAHLYFTRESRISAAALRISAINYFGAHARVSRLIDEAIGPHPLPMFEMDFSTSDFSLVVPWILLNHGNHSVLIHPITGNDLEDHRDHAFWVGKQLPLKLEVLPV